MRNPKWKRDEIILALDLYFKIKPGQIHANNPAIIELSEILNRLPIHDFRPDSVKFRNPNGVGLKLSNFLAIDPNNPGKGMEAFSKLDKEVFDEFVNDKQQLAKIANRIKKTASKLDLGNKLYKIEDDDSLMVKEGKVIYKLHKFRERDQKINQKKKDSYFSKHGKLDCEICGFDFFQFYGELGKGFIECHHKAPLHELDEETQTKLKDLALVCSNCHRMLHRRIGGFEVKDLKEIVNRNFNK